MRRSTSPPYYVKPQLTVMARFSESLRKSLIEAQLSIKVRPATLDMPSNFVALTHIIRTWQ